MAAINKSRQDQYSPINIVETLSTVHVESVDNTERVVSRINQNEQFVLHRDKSNLETYQEPSKKFKVNLATNYDSILKMKSQSKKFSKMPSLKDISMNATPEQTASKKFESI